MSNLKSSSCTSYSLSQRSTSSFTSQKRAIEGLQKKLKLKEDDVNELRQTNQQGQNTIIKLRQENETLLEQINVGKFQFNTKVEEMERFQYTNHLHRKSLMVQHRENLETLQNIIVRKDQEIELFKNQLHEIIKNKYYECENLRHQVEMFKEKLQQITSDNLTIEESIERFKVTAGSMTFAKQGNQDKQNSNNVVKSIETAGDTMNSESTQKTVALLMIDEKAETPTSLDQFGKNGSVLLPEGQGANKETDALELIAKLKICEESTF
jgi:hypothetical protein